MNPINQIIENNCMQNQAKILKEDNEGIHQEIYVILMKILMEISLGIERIRVTANLKALDSQNFKKIISIFLVNLNFLILSYLANSGQNQTMVQLMILVLLYQRQLILTDQYQNSNSLYHSQMAKVHLKIWNY